MTASDQHLIIIIRKALSSRSFFRCIIVLFLLLLSFIFSIDRAHNSKIRSFLCQELQKESNNHSKSTIKRKLHNYYFAFVEDATGPLLASYYTIDIE